MHRWAWVACTLWGLFLTTAKSDRVVIQFDQLQPGSEPFEQISPNMSNSLLPNSDTSDDIRSITYGNSARKGQYPYMAVILMYYYGYYYKVCGGVIINQHSVLTAAHCLRNLKYYKYYVGVGILSLKLGRANPGSQVILVTSHTIHPYYNPYAPGFPNNLAVLHLYCRIKYNTYVQPAPLATKHDGRFPRNYCYIVGWGYTEWGYPDILQKAGIFSINNYQCRLFWAISPRARILDTHICMYRYPVSSCYGDAGGPLICRGKVAGIMSWGSRDCYGCLPGVCSRVSSYIKWIKKAASLS